MGTPGAIGYPRRGVTPVSIAAVEEDEMDGVSEALKKQVMERAQGALSLQVAFIGVANGLFEALARSAEPLRAVELARSAEVDAAYTERWCDAAYAFELLDVDDNGALTLTELGRGFLPDAPGTLLPFAVMANFTGHMADRATMLMRTGERPGEQVLEEREAVNPLFGPMMEVTFGPFFERHILPQVAAFARIDARGGLAVDLGCGNGWFLRRLVKGCPHLRGLGMDMSAERIDQATALTEDAGLADRLSFKLGDLYHFASAEPVDLIAMNRALHHVWGQDEARRRDVFRMLHNHLAPGGSAVIWEPVWPADRAELREPGKRGLAFQNLAEHIQGNRFLRPEEIVAELERAGLRAEVHLFGEGKESVIVGTRPG